MLLWAAREAVVPPSFDELGDKIRKVKTGTIGGAAAPRPHGLQLGEGARAHQETRELGQELLYTGIPISEVFRQDMGIGGVLSLLWF